MVIKAKDLDQYKDQQYRIAMLKLQIAICRVKYPQHVAKLTAWYLKAGGKHEDLNTSSIAVG